MTLKASAGKCHMLLSFTFHWPNQQHDMIISSTGWDSKSVSSFWQMGLWGH